MELLGVLLGITMSAVVGCIWYGMRLAASLQSRVSMLEKRNALPVASVPEEVAKLPKLRYRTWNEDAVVPEGVK